MRAELAGLNHCAVPFLSRANLCEYYNLSMHIIMYGRFGIKQMHLNNLFLIKKNSSVRFDIPGTSKFREFWSSVYVKVTCASTFHALISSVSFIFKVPCASTFHALRSSGRIPALVTFSILVPYCKQLLIHCLIFTFCQTKQVSINKWTLELISSFSRPGLAKFAVQFKWAIQIFVNYGRNMRLYR